MSVVIPAFAIHYALLAVNAYYFLNNWLGELTDKLILAYEAFSNPQVFVFFKGVAGAFDARHVSLIASASAIPEFYYEPANHLFYPYIPTERQEDVRQGKQICLPMLSLEILDNSGKVHYDLTDFLEKIRFVEREGCTSPAVAHLVAAWQTSSHIIVDPTRFKARFLTSDAEEIECSLVAPPPPRRRRRAPTEDSVTSGGSTEAVVGAATA